MRKCGIPPWPGAVASGGADRPYRLPEGRKRPEVCEDGGELSREEDASMCLGTFADPEHARAFLLLCSVPRSSARSLLCTHALPRAERLGKVLAGTILHLHLAWG